MDWLKLAIRKCRSFWRLDGDDRWLLLQSFLLLGFVAISLKFWGFKRTQGFLAKLLETKKPGFCDNLGWEAEIGEKTKKQKKKKPGFCNNLGKNSEICEKKPGFCPPCASKIIKTTRMVQLAARYCQPWANCLKKSLVLWGLLRHQGIESELRIGVKKDEGNFAAHAWVEYEGFVLNDSQNVRDRFSMFDSV